MSADAGHKKAQLIRMLSGKAGADVQSISDKLGWQPHTARAAITGLRKAGYEIMAARETGKPTRYRIGNGPDDPGGIDNPVSPAGQANAG